MKDGVWEEGAEDAEDAGEEARGGGRYRSKNKNPTQGCREKSQCKTVKRNQLKSRRTQTRGALRGQIHKKNRAQDSKKPGNPLQFSKYSR